MEIYSYKELEKASARYALTDTEVNEVNKQLLEGAACGNKVAFVIADKALPQSRMRTVFEFLKHNGYQAEWIRARINVALPFNY